MAGSFSSGSTTRDSASRQAGGLGENRDGGGLRGSAGFRKVTTPRRKRDFFQSAMDARARMIGVFAHPLGGFLTDAFEQITGKKSSVDRSRAGIVDPKDLEGRDSAGDSAERRVRLNKKKKKTLATDDVSPEPNIGNVSGLGGKRDVTGLGIMQRRRARGASLINLVPTLADTTRRALFGL